MLAITMGALVLRLASLVMRWRDDQATRRAASAAMIMVVTQWAIGFTSLVLLVPVTLQLLHVLAADLLWLAVIWLAAAALADQRDHHPGHESRSVGIKDPPRAIIEMSQRAIEAPCRPKGTARTQGHERGATSHDPVGPVRRRRKRRNGQPLPSGLRWCSKATVAASLETSTAAVRQQQPRPFDGVRLDLRARSASVSELRKARSAGNTAMPISLSNATTPSRWRPARSTPDAVPAAIASNAVLIGWVTYRL